MAAFIAAYVTAISRIPDYRHRGKQKFFFSNTEGVRIHPLYRIGIVSDFCFPNKFTLKMKKWLLACFSLGVFFKDY